MNTYKYEYKSDPVRAGETLTHDVKGPCLAAFSVFQRFACYEKYPQQSGNLIFLINAEKRLLLLKKKIHPSHLLNSYTFFAPSTPRL